MSAFHNPNGPFLAALFCCLFVTTAAAQTVDDIAKLLDTNTCAVLHLNSNKILQKIDLDQPLVKSAKDQIETDRSITVEDLQRFTFFLSSGEQADEHIALYPVGTCYWFANPVAVEKIIESSNRDNWNYVRSEEFSQQVFVAKDPNLFNQKSAFYFPDDSTIVSASFHVVDRLIDAQGLANPELIAGFNADAELYLAVDGAGMLRLRDERAAIGTASNPALLEMKMPDGTDLFEALLRIELIIALDNMVQLKLKLNAANVEHAKTIEQVIQTVKLLGTGAIDGLLEDPQAKGLEDAGFDDLPQLLDLGKILLQRMTIRRNEQVIEVDVAGMEGLDSLPQSLVKLYAAFTAMNSKTADESNSID